MPQNCYLTTSLESYRDSASGFISCLSKSSKMISSKKLTKTARKWQKLAALMRKSIVMLRLPVDKGHFIIYTVDKKGSWFHLIILATGSLVSSSKCLKISRAFHRPNHGAHNPVVCSRGASKDLKKALLSSVASLNLLIISSPWRTKDTTVTCLQLLTESHQQLLLSTSSSLVCR